MITYWQTCPAWLIPKFGNWLIKMHSKVESTKHKYNINTRILIGVNHEGQAVAHVLWQEGNNFPHGN